jgi:hypothetical protein
MKKREINRCEELHLKAARGSSKASRTPKPLSESIATVKDTIFYVWQCNILYANTEVKAQT